VSASAVTDLDDITRLVLAPNPSPMTLEGTNTYLLGDPSHGALVVVDPGPDDPAHRRTVEAALDGADVAAVIITHHHPDHAAAAGWAGEWGAPLRAFDPALVPGATALSDGGSVVAAGIAVEAIHTPGHASDHLCLRVVQTDVVLTGDHVLGRGSTVVFWPDGDMTAYMASLERLAQAPGRRIYPGHGPVVDDPAAKVQEYLAHRRDREAQIRQAILDGATSGQQVVAAVYTDVPSVLHPAALRSVQAVLEMLVAAGEVDPALAPVHDPHAPEIDHG
jgi:glyoxylase-like metal-dependent hydrolase (beta-lactamase superfamily II)